MHRGLLRRLHRAADKAKGKFHSNIFQLGLHLRSPYLAALGLAGMSGPWNRPGSGKSVYLAFYKDIGAQDLHALAKGFSDIELRVLRVGVFRRIVTTIFGRPSWQKLSGSSFYDESGNEQLKSDYRDFCRRLVRALRRTMNLQGAISCNFNYECQHEFAQACLDEGLPFVILFKEWHNVPERKDDFLRYYTSDLFRGTLRASMVLTCNDYIAKSLAACGFKGLNPACIHPVGMARADFYRGRMVAKGRSSIVVFGFDPVFSFRYFDEMHAAEPQEAQALKDELIRRTGQCYAAIFDFALKNPEVEVIVKAKNKLSYVTNYTDRLGTDLLPANLVITNAGKAMDLILAADAVVALNSTTTSEALLAGKRVLTPDYADFFPGKAWHFFHAFPGLLHPFKSSDDISKALAGGPIPEDQRLAYLETYLDHKGESVAVKVERRLLEALSAPNSRLA